MNSHKHTKQFFGTKALIAVLAMVVFASCTKTKDFSADYDIAWPVPVISSLSAVKDTVGKTLTITGEKFEKLTKVTVGNPETDATIVSSTANSIVVRIPRNVSAGPVTVYTNYKQKGVSKDIFTPVYLDATVTGWPARITRGQAFIIQGTNMDMVTEVDVDGNKIQIAPAPGAPTDQISVSTQGLTLPDQVVVKVTKARAGINNGTSPAINVENPSAFFIPEAPVVLFDFENGVNGFVPDGAAPPTAAIVSTAPLARGGKYFSLVKPGAANWAGIGAMSYSNPVNLSAFHKPHLTFLVNTKGKDGYFQAEFVQGGTKWGLHFKNANSGFDYNLKTAGWTWVTVELKTDNLEKWGGSGTSFDPKGVIDQVNLGFKLGNGDNGYELNVDQVMITDGPQKPVFKAFDFEDGVNPYTGTFTSGINLSGIEPISGDKYLTVSSANTGSWNWSGDINASGPIDLSNVANAYLNVWVNTNGKEGNFQIEITQGGIKWGGNLDASAYLVKTNGWKLYSLRLADIGWSKWGGTGTATTLDPKGTLDYLKLGFSSGNIAGPYEINIDDVYISDGPMF